MLSRCTKCQGRKWIMGMGAIMKECTVCNGVGHVKLDVVLSKPLENIVLANTVESELAKPSEGKIDKRSKEYRESKKLAGE